MATALPPPATSHRINTGKSDVAVDATMTQTPITTMPSGQQANPAPAARQRGCGDRSQQHAQSPRRLGEAQVLRRPSDRPEHEDRLERRLDRRREHGQPGDDQDASYQRRAEAVAQSLDQGTSVGMSTLQPAGVGARSLERMAADNANEAALIRKAEEVPR